MRLIDADALIEKLEEMANDKWNIQVGASKGLEGAIDVIDNTPTVNPCNNCDLYFIAKTKQEMQKGGAV